MRLKNIVARLIRVFVNNDR